MSSLGLSRIDISSINLDDIAPETVKNLLLQCVEAYNSDKALYSAKLLHEIDGQLELLPDADDTNRKRIREVLESDAMKGIRRISFEQEHLYDLLSHNDGWTLVKETTCRRNAKVWYRPEPGTAMHSFKIEGKLRAPLMNCLALVNEIDLYGQWLPFLTRTEEMKRFHRNCRVAIIEWAMVWPMWWRDFCVRGIATDALDTNDGILVTCIDYENPNDAATKPEFPPRRGVCRISVEHGCMLLKPISKKELQFTAIMHVDPKLQYFPMSLINWAATYVAFYGLLYFERRARALAKADPENDPHLIKMQTDREFYGEVERRLNEFSSRAELPEGEDLENSDDDDDFDEDNENDEEYDEDDETTASAMRDMELMQAERDENEKDEQPIPLDQQQQQQQNANNQGKQSWSSWFWGYSS